MISFQLFFTVLSFVSSDQLKKTANLFRGRVVRLVFVVVVVVICERKLFRQLTAKNFVLVDNSSTQMAVTTACQRNTDVLHDFQEVADRQRIGQRHPHETANPPNQTKQKTG